MARELEREIDELKSQIDDIKKVLTVKLLEIQLGGRQPSVQSVQAPRDAAQTQSVQDTLDRMEEASRANGETGRVVSYLGVFDNSQQRYRWVQDKISTDELFQLVEDRTAEKVLSCVGSNERLSILLALLKEPMTVAALVEKCGYNTTGQVYHHLKPLIAADLVIEDKKAPKGTYIVQPQRVQGVVMLLAGVHGLVVHF